MLFHRFPVDDQFREGQRVQKPASHVVAERGEAAGRRARHHGRGAAGTLGCQGLVVDGIASAEVRAKGPLEHAPSFLRDSTTPLRSCRPAASNSRTRTPCPDRLSHTATSSTWCGCPSKRRNASVPGVVGDEPDRAGRDVLCGRGPLDDLVVDDLTSTQLSRGAETLPRKSLKMSESLVPAQKGQDQTAGMQGAETPRRVGPDVRAVCRELMPQQSASACLAEHREAQFSAGTFADGPYPLILDTRDTGS